MSIGSRIKTLRLERGMTQEELAQKAGVQYQAINKYEKGVVTNIPVERLQAIAAALCVNITEFLDSRGQLSSEIEQNKKLAYLINFSIGQNIYKRRVALGMTMEELAEKVGVQKTAINKVEKGIINLSVMQLCLFANALSVSFPELITVVEPPFSKAFGAIIRTRRECLCLSQEEIASRMGAHKQDISRYECGKVDVPLNRLPDLAKALETDIASLFSSFGR